jgi:hypothetical protein
MTTKNFTNDELMALADALHVATNHYRKLARDARALASDDQWRGTHLADSYRQMAHELNEQARAADQLATRVKVAMTEAA